MKELVPEIINHPNANTFLREILDGNCHFFCNIVAKLNGGDARKVGIDLRKTLEHYLTTKNNVTHEFSKDKKTFREFLWDKETVQFAMLYMMKSLSNRLNSNFPYALIALFISLERKEQDFQDFLMAIQGREEVDLKELLYSFWLLN